MTPIAFVSKWRDSTLSESAGAQPFFLDLCELLGVEKPSDPDNYCFERGATRTGAGHGWADVWKRGCFAWENKGPGGDLGRALKQLMTYALALDNPPLLVVCNRALIEIHTHFTGTPSEVHTIRLDDVGRPENLEKLRWVFTAPDRFRPTRTVLDVTAEAAGRFAEIAQSMQLRRHAPEKVAHFLIQCLFCMFAEDVGLLPAKLFQRIVGRSTDSPTKLGARLGELFKSMQVGGDFMLEDIAWFNGGLFEVIEPIPLDAGEVKALLAASNMNWSHIEPSIFGTMFERGLDPRMRAQLGAQFTDPGTINKIIEPVIVRPLAAEWEAAKEVIAKAMVKYQAGGRGSQSGLKTAQETLLRFVERLKNFRVLDPACGSGNFLYLALRAIKDLEHRANLDAEALGLHRQLTIETSPANVFGIEINAYAAELARVTVWIGEIQWMLKNGYDIQRRPILAALNHIECRDAILNDDGTEAAWPKVDAIVGNPPFLGDKRMRDGLGHEYVEKLRTQYDGRVPGGADLVTYWFEKARAQLERSAASAAGLVGTNSIRGGANRRVLDRIVGSSTIFEAWSDEDWINDGASVRVSLVAFGSSRQLPQLNGMRVAYIFADLTASDDASEGVDLATAHCINSSGTAFIGTQKGGPFDIPDELARRWLPEPNVNGLSNAMVLRPWVNGLDITRRPNHMWLIDFEDMSAPQAAQYSAPWQYCEERVRPTRDGNREERTGNAWWQLQRRRPEMKAALKSLPRFIATARVAKHRVFTFLDRATLADSQVVAIARADDTTFGILQSRFHQVWSLRLCTWLGVGNDPRYTPTTCFETFPFPAALTPADTADQQAEAIADGALIPSGLAPSPRAHAAAIARAAHNLDVLRARWLNPPEWVEFLPEVVPGFPDRIVAKPGHEADLKKRTLTNLYNARPAWLDNAHRDLDAAVALSYGWTDYTPAMPDEEILRRLLELNLQRAGAQ